MNWRCLALLIPFLVGFIGFSLVLCEPSSGQSLLVYVGTYTRGDSKGIYALRLDTATGALTSLGLAAETANPSFLAVDPGNRFLYAVGEMNSFNGKPGGAVTAFAINRADGKLTLLNQASSGGGGPCHLAVDQQGKYVLVANYNGGNLTVLSIGSDGKLGDSSAFIQHEGSSVNRERQAGPHAHGVYLDTANRFAVVADLGLDKLLTYRFDPAKGTLEANDPPSASVRPGAGPRHFSFHPDNRHAYVINELDSTLTIFEFEANNGAFKELATVSSLSPDFNGRNFPAEIAVHPSGKFVYGSNRGADTIAIFAVDQTTGALAPVGWQPTQGRTPRNIAIDPSGRYLLAANQDSANIVVFAIDQATGKLTPNGQTATVDSPVCITFVR
ncbi:MAG: lactonase family protein [Acidobacteria bacterium]|nr:MAG: lactonase family protein [Acidobacteriota bacterium]